MSSQPDRPAAFRAGGDTGLIAPAAAPAAALAEAVAGAVPVTYLADVSEFEPDIADAAYLRWTKAIVIRALYGDAHDDKAWYGGARRTDLHAGGARFVGIYQYLRAGQDGAAQARAFHALVGAIRAGEVFIADFEEGGRPALTAWYNEMAALYGLHIRPYLWTYTGLFFGGEQGVLPVEWIAAYEQAEPTTPHKLWQFSGKYPVPGVGVADCSLFHGSIDQLAALASQAKPPADWTYGKPQNLRIKPGHTNFHATWSAPSGQPKPAFYLVSVYEGKTCDSRTLVKSYPRHEAWPVTSPDPGSLKEHTFYTVRVSAFGPGGSRAEPGVFASGAFKTD